MSTKLFLVIHLLKPRDDKVLRDKCRSSSRSKLYGVAMCRFSATTYNCYRWHHYRSIGINVPEHIISSFCLRFMSKTSLFNKSLHTQGNASTLRADWRFLSFRAKTMKERICRVTSKAMSSLLIVYLLKKIIYMGLDIGVYKIGQRFPETVKIFYWGY